MRAFLTVAIASLACTAGGCSRAEAQSPGIATDKLPETWNLVQIAAAALRSPKEKAIDSDVMCWQVREDGRPLRVESCILWLRFAEQDKPKWRVSYLFRHPLGNNQWEEAIVFDAPIPHFRDFDHPPSSAEILKFIKATEWSWELKEKSGGFVFDPTTKSSHPVTGFKYVEGRVCLNNWKARTGVAFGLKVPQEYLR